MEIFEKLYVDQVNLFKQKGYTSSDKLSSVVNTGFLGKLLYKFLEAYQKSSKTNQPSLFYVSTADFFDKVPAEVKLVFNYKYSPAESVLSIQNLYVTMKGVSETFTLNYNTELPNPDTIFNRMVKAYEIHPQKKFDDFWEGVKNHKNFLIERGFDDKGLNNHEPTEKFMERWMEAFKNGLLQNIATYFCPFSFSVETKGFFNSSTDIVKFKFGYEYDPKAVSIILRTLTAKMDETKIYYLKNETDLPHSLIVHKQFCEKHKLLNQIIPALNQKFGPGKKTQL